jgi:Acyl-CoA dehydrogenase, N-terminal domain
MAFRRPIFFLTPRPVSLAVSALTPSSPQEVSSKRIMSFLARSISAKIRTSRNGALAFVRPTGSRSITTYAQLPEEHRMVYDMCRKFADEELAPNAGTWDKQHAFPTDAVKQLVRNTPTKF